MPEAATIIPAPLVGAALDRDGFVVIDDVLDTDQCEVICKALADIVLSARSAGERNILRRPEILSLVRLPSLAAVVREILGEGAFAYKATFFDKTPQANWKVAWHQDLSIPVRSDDRPDGWTAWSVKANALYAHPPAEQLAGLLTVRVHLDSCDADNGALRIIPGCHVAGRLDLAQIQIWKTSYPPITCSVHAGGLMLMRPLLLHASSASANPVHRRIVHLEFAAEELPAGLDWAERVPLRS